MRRLSSWSSTTRMRLLTGLLLRLHPHRQREPEDRAVPRARFHPDAPPVQLDDPPGDGQPKARAALPARARAVGLLELLEDLLLVGLGDARTGVGDRDQELAVGEPRLDRHLADLGELDR